MSEQQQEMTREQYVNLSKIDSLAKQNATQAVRIAELETQINLLNMQLQQMQQGDQPEEQEEPVPGEEPLAEDMGNPPH
jgi:hypothetical protein